MIAKAKHLLKSLLRATPGKRHLYGVMRRHWVPGFYRSLRFAGPFTVRIDDRHAFRMMQLEEYGIETELFWQGIDRGWESVSLALWRKLLTSGATVLDIGANHGMYTLLTCALCPQARVLAFEPLPSAHRVLAENVALNRFPAVCLPLALSDHNGEAPFYARDEGGFTEGTLLRAHAGDAAPPARMVPVRRLDTVIAEQGLRRVDLMKIDVEGAEAEVLRGMGLHLAAFRPAILVEVLEDGVGREIEAIVGGLGYAYFDINDDPRNGSLGTRLVPHIRRGSCLNYLLLPRDHPAYAEFAAVAVPSAR